MYATAAPVPNGVASPIGGSSGDDQKASSPSSPSDVTTPSDLKNNSNTTEYSDVNMNNNQSRRDLIGDCALVEIIHLHDCLRGALNALEKDLIDLSKMLLCSTSAAASDAQEAQRIQLQTHHQSISKLESKATARFQVIWSVFRAHSAAEDEFIWPALRDKTQGAVNGSPCGSPCGSPRYQPNQEHHQHEIPSYAVAASNARAVHDASDDDEVVEQEEYEEDHADEERIEGRKKLPSSGSQAFVQV
ncbi:unnamed protein product [Pseudo-nitzschia multistriata]|uniref:Hemerythrin-like domain-containing protein n=1 Tax=Pseudo-nitzschia multistriata TaxID=183589 RepID=A0A448ZIZ5_9STRA|nr:unnamed protein product [Pseudo-nitzschia multistriata]